MTTKEIRNALFDKLPADWQDQLRFFIKSSDFDDILTKLELEVREGRRFTPGLKDIFKPFILCPVSNVKVVFLTPSPNPDPSINTGLGIDSNSIPRVSIGYFRFRAEMMKQYPNVLCNLSRLAEQGCLFLNSSLTTQILNGKSHQHIWSPFILNVFRILDGLPGVIWVSIGEEFLTNRLNEKHFKIKLKRLPVTREESWDSENLFLKINEQLKFQNKSELFW